MRSECAHRKDGMSLATPSYSLEVTRGSVCMGEIAGQKPGWIFLESLSLAEQICASQEDPQSFKVQLPSQEQPTILQPSAALRSSEVRSSSAPWKGDATSVNSENRRPGDK